MTTYTCNWSNCGHLAICTITTDAWSERDREFSCCESCAREVMREFDVRDVDGFTLAELYGPEGAEWLVGVPMAVRLANLRGQTA